MPTKPIRFDVDRADQLTAGPTDVDPDTATKAARYVTRTLGDQAGEVLRAGWGQHGSTQQRRYAVEAPDRRRKCHCGCGGRRTHVGMANGLALMSGCHWYVRLWVKDPDSPLRRQA